MKRIPLLIALLIASTAGAQSYQTIIDDPSRPNTDREEDDRRKPAELMSFSGLTAGSIVLEIGAGRGYTTELASRAVGPTGKVYAHRLDPARIIGKRLPNVVVLPNEPADPGERFAAAGMALGSVDRVLAFFSLHDGHNSDEFDAQLWYRTMLEYLKPGGELVVMDNTAPADSKLEFTPTVHRIDPLFLKNEILKAGFEFVVESDAWRNADDDLESSWFEDIPSRASGYQDRFAYRFRKPD
jgi:predicted methyltransferase